MHGKPVKALTITLNPTGCYWARNGGCTMCGEFEGSAKEEMIPDHIHIAQFAKAVADLVSLHKPTWLRINQEGNYTNSSETASIAQTTILKLASQIKGIERITIESRPQYLNELILKEFSAITTQQNVELEIGMGFEASDDVVRNICVNKGEQLDDFKNALNLMNTYNVRSLAYILLKPPFLTECEAIDIAIQSVKDANELGFKRISLEPMSIHKYTVVDALAHANCYRVPWFWSIIKVIEQCKEIPDLGVGGVGYFPPPLHQAHNHCNYGGHCNIIVAKALAEYTKTRDKAVFNALDCSCKSDWEEECSVENMTPLKARISQQLNCVDIDTYRTALQIASTSLQPEQTLANSIFIARGSQQMNHVGGG